MAKSTGKELSKLETFSDDDAREIANSGANAWDLAMRVAQERYGAVVRASEVLGDGFAMIDDPTPLIGKPFFLFDWRFVDGDYDGEFATMRILTPDGKCFRYNDGGTGVCATLRDFTDKYGQSGGLFVGSGFRTSTYTTCKSCNRPRNPGGDEGNPPCQNLLKNGTECGDTSMDRGTGQTLYLDITEQHQ